MHRSADRVRRRPGTLKPLATGCALAFATLAVMPQQADAQTPAVASAPVAVDLPALAQQLGIPIVADAALLRGKAVSPMKGSFTPQQALQRLLSGTGLEAVLQGGSFVLRIAAPAGVPIVSTLPEVRVRASAEVLPGELPRPYAGGQVAKGAGVGMLGNKGFLDTPFSQISYTAELIANVQAQTLGEVLESSPSATRIGGRFFSNDGFTIRGFNVSGTDLSYDGMYGLTQVRRIGIESIDRVELLKGPSALLNGVPPTGGIGGSVNLIPKRATDAPVTDLTLNYLSDANVGAHLDMGRRFGTDNVFGIRVNVAQKDGRTAFDYNRERASLASVALDYRGENLRLYADLNYEKLKSTAPIFSGWQLADDLPIPKAPDARTNQNPPWTFTQTERNFNLVRGEYDLSDAWTASLGYGWQNINETQYVAYGQTIFNAAGDVTEPSVYRLGRSERRFGTWDAKLRGRFDTGPITHRLAFAAYRLVNDETYGTQYQSGSGATSNIYDLVVNYPQPSFDGVAPDGGSNELTMQALAVADTVSFLQDRVQLTLGARRQSIKEVDRSTGLPYYDESATTPAVALLYKVSDRLALYANYIEGLSEGPTAPDTAANANEVFPPARSKQKEVGAKVDLGRIAGTVALFEITQPSGVTNTATNIFSVDGQQRNRGIELETFGEAAKGVRLIGGVTWLDAKLIKTDGGVNQGNRAPNTPTVVASLGGEWDTPFIPGLTVTGRAIYNSSKYLDETNTRSIPAWTRVDLGARYETRIGGQRTTWRAGITNLLNGNYWEGAAYSSLTLGPPRMVSLSATIGF